MLLFRIFKHYQQFASLATQRYKENYGFNLDQNTPHFAYGVACHIARYFSSALFILTLYGCVFSNFSKLLNPLQRLFRGKGAESRKSELFSKNVARKCLKSFALIEEKCYIKLA